MCRRLIRTFASIVAFLGVAAISLPGYAGKGVPGGGGGVELPTALQSPMRATFTERGDLLVADHDLGMIVRLDSRTLQIVAAYPVGGQPLGVATSGKAGNLLMYVGNETTRRVEVLDKAGVVLRQLGGPRDYVWQPTDMAVDEVQGRLFVVDGQEKAVKVFALTGGDLLYTIPATYPGNVLIAPTGIALDPARQEIYVADYGDGLYVKARVQVFSYNGALLRTISGKLGMLGQRFSRPQGLAVDPLGRLFLVDCVSGEVLVYNGLTGAGLKTIGTFGTEPGQLNFPLDVVVDDLSKDVFVTNNRAGRIEVFPGAGVVP